MKNKHVTKELPDYLDNLLKADHKKLVEAHLKRCDSCSKEMIELKKLLDAFTLEEMETPSASIKTRFHEQLELEILQDARIVQLNPSNVNTKNKWPWNFLKVAASIVLLVSAFLLGRHQHSATQEVKVDELLNPEKDSNRSAILALMENKSASKRIQGINFMFEFENPDEVIVKTLADRMLHDENTNVRLMSVEALSRFTSSETVKDALIKALKTEKDPAIQISIIQILVKIQEKKAIAPMQQLLEQEDTEPFVKEQLKSLIPSII